MYCKLIFASWLVSLLVFCSRSGSAQFLENFCGQSREGLEADAVGPWTAVLHYSGRIVCLGALIHERFTLTAAHCGDSGGFLKVRLEK